MEIKINDDVSLFSQYLPNKDDLLSFINGLQFQINHVNMDLLTKAIEYNNQGLQFKNLEETNNRLFTLDDSTVRSTKEPFVGIIEFEINDNIEYIPLSDDEFKAFNSLKLPLHESNDSISNTKANNAALCAILLNRDGKQKYTLADIKQNVSLYYSLFSIYIEDSTYTDYNKYLCLKSPVFLGNVLFKVRISDFDRSDDEIIKDSIYKIINAITLL